MPGLVGVILTMTMVLMTGLAITREQERGTMENLLSTPVTALEVMTGKIVRYVMIGLVQVTLVLILAHLIFDVPMHGNLGMPGWAQAIGEVLPLTHFLRIVRGVLLKGNAWADVLPETWPIVAFMAVVMLIGLRTFRGTLD